MESPAFDLMSSDFKRDPFPAFARMRAEGHLVRGRLPVVGQVWLPTTYEAVNHVLRDSENFIQEGNRAGAKGILAKPWWLPRTIRVLASNMLARDEPDHRRLRVLVEQAFQRQHVQEMRGEIEALAEGFLDVLERAAAAGGTADLIEHFARPFPLAVICSLLGLPQEDRPRFLRWAGRVTSTRNPLMGLALGLPGLVRLNRYFVRQFRECRARPRPGLISALVAAEHEGKGLTEEELLAMAFLLLFAGHETTVHLISNSVRTLLAHPQQKAELLAEWSGIGPAVEELLRFTSPVQITKPRFAVREMELYGRKIHRGDCFMPVLGSANCDPAKFVNPEQLDLRRHPNPHLGFGTGIHVCLGLKLARVETEIALQRLFTRFPEIRLAIPDEQLRWTRLGVRAMTALPVRLA